MMSAKTIQKSNLRQVLLEANLGYIIEEFDEEAAGMSIDNVPLSYTKPLPWKCRFNTDHTWNISLRARRRGCGLCPKCPRLPKKNGITEKEYPLLFKEWSPDNERGLQYYTKGCGQKGKWVCSYCNWKWKTQIALRVKGHGCPKCGNQKKTLSYKRNYAAGLISREKKKPKTFEQSFASHKFVQYWNYEMNDEKPNEVFLHSGIARWFNCPNCSHPVKRQIDNLPDKWTECNFCRTVNGRREVCGNKNCKPCYNRSFAVSPYAKYWNYKLNEDDHPYKHCIHSSSEKWFTCPNCRHNFIKGLTHITSAILYDYEICPYCVTRRGKLCGSQTCVTCYEKSFAACDKAKWWDYKQNEPVKPIHIFRRTANKYWFICPNTQISFMSTPDRLTDRGCPCCKNKTEKILLRWLILTFVFLTTVTPQVTYDWCMNIFHLPFDFELHVFDMFIELDGRQHFKHIEKWDNDVENQVKRDIYKIMCAIKNGKSVLRLSCKSVRDETWDWRTYIRKCVQLQRINQISVVYLPKCEKDLYKKHIKLLQQDNNVSIIYV